ncbi:type II toxin-antitoxin system antitoxin SocA domain-containing protein [Mitsuaria sp. 7]|uniref:Panacea domain-containing protein n=1 Tax=Mitsuaria sp. 7 TaxID=1658665 RepID=UPI0009EED233
MPYSPALVANAVLYRAKQRGFHVSHLKLQKLVFFTHAWRLALHNRAAVEERPEAWEHGPIFSTLYHRLRAPGTSSCATTSRPSSRRPMLTRN